MRFVIDEDMPRSLGPALVRLGHEVLDVRDHKLRGASDAEVLHFAIVQQAALITEDLGFANLLRFPLASHRGIIVSRYPDTVSTNTVIAALAHAVELVGTKVGRTLVIVEPGRIRVRGAAAADGP